MKVPSWKKKTSPARIFFRKITWSIGESPRLICWGTFSIAEGWSRWSSPDTVSNSTSNTSSDWLTPFLTGAFDVMACWMGYGWVAGIFIVVIVVSQWIIPDFFLRYKQQASSRQAAGKQQASSRQAAGKQQASSNQRLPPWNKNAQIFF